MNALVISANPGLVDEVRRLAAAASVEVTVARDAAEARNALQRAALVLIGADLPGRIPRREGVIVLARGATVPVYRRAMELGAERVAVLPDEEAWLTERMARACLPGAFGRQVSVTGARGGAGASVFATTLALMAARAGARVLLVDLDAGGGGLDALLGLEGVPGTRWPDLAGLRGRLAPRALEEAVPSARGVGVLSHAHDRPCQVRHEVLSSVLAAARGAYDLVVADRPRDVELPVETGDRAVLLVPAEVRGVLAARSVPAGPDETLLVTRGPAPGRLAPRAVAESLCLPLAGHYDFERGVPAAVERAAPPVRGRLARLCARLLDGPLAA
ncbi:septum site-determining protein Ssd [Actinocorallia sp. A-T 12471]|uniref:septum site-determining protein Ssd n=1 Tax=Actinocorallia sp. A-T 12471 TaxID=3089813 RepID=UPI0029CD4A4D|nr:septum site-determining protein Ssd [Actinocorallia sp. A-T 12471]MDX6742563.1 septum site-determining protein Ssd [Actinocorallia sp. A-T 12471]